MFKTNRSAFPFIDFENYVCVNIFHLLRYSEKIRHGLNKFMKSPPIHHNSFYIKICTEAMREWNTLTTTHMLVVCGYCHSLVDQEIRNIDSPQLNHYQQNKLPPISSLYITCIFISCMIYFPPIVFDESNAQLRCLKIPHW